MTCEVAVFGFTLKPIPYSYIIPQGLNLQPGQVVEVPFGKRKRVGIVVSTYCKDLSIFDLKPLLKVLSSEPALTKIQLELARWISETYFISIAEALKLFLHRLPKAVSNLNANQDQELIIFPTIDQVLNAHKMYSSVVYGPHLLTRDFDRAWQQIKSGEAGTIISTRSGVFAPFNRLKKITIFQTESDLYKNERRPYDRTFAIAERLAELSQARLRAISYSPRIQDHYHVPHEIKKATQHFNYQIVNLKKHPVINKTLLSALRKSDPSKTLIFLNRKTDRGSLVCRTCKEVSFTNDPSTCPNCGGANVKFKIINLDSFSKKIREQIEGDFTFSTQQIFFQNAAITRFKLIVVLSADTYLHQYSYNAKEKTFGMITNLIRILESKGSIIIQTSFGGDPSINLAVKNDYLNFYRQELRERRDANYPPFTKIAKLSYTGTEYQEKPNLSAEIETLGPFGEIHPHFIARGQNLKALQSLSRPWKLDIDPLSI
jgi:primosomal protein N'